MQTIRGLREQLRGDREDEELMALRKVCAGIAKVLSVRKGETAALERQRVTLRRDSEELRGDISRRGTGLM